MSSTILIVEADRATATVLTDQLTADGYTTAAVTTIAGVRRAADELHPDLLLLGDVPERRGALDLVAEIRAGRSAFDEALPVLMLSARRTELDVVRAFQHGADDVAPKPFSYPELRARIAALLRRCARRERASVRVGPLEVDTRARVVRVDGRPVELTQREYQLLRHLASDPERVFTKDQLLKAVWGCHSLGASRTLDSHACRLRDKLRRGGDQRWVVNVWGVGYALRQPSVGEAA
jgi:DNA-binding response OmpR family regulator